MIANIDREVAIQRAKNLRGARKGFQIALQYVVAQSLNGNADAAGIIFSAAGLYRDPSAKVDFTKDGQAAKAFLLGAVSAGGCGMDGIIRWDKDARRWKMRRDWKSNSQKLNYAQLWANLQNNPWYLFETTPKEKPAFDLAKAMASLAKKAIKAGATEEEIIREAQIAADNLPIGTLVMGDIMREIRESATH